MSFILDALKKSEAERHSQSGPALMNMRIVPPRRRMPLWIIALTVILLANFAVLAIVLLRAPAAPAPQPAVSQAASLPPQPAPASPQPAQPQPAPPQQTMPANVLPPPVLLPEPTAPPRDTPPAAPRPQPAAPMQAAPVSAATLSEDARLPSATDLRLSAVALPELRISLHVYDTSAANRYVLLNSQRMREGESTADGVLLERVTPTGLVLSWRGQRFRLEAGE